MRQRIRGPGGSNTCPPTTCLSNHNARDHRRDHSPFPSGVTVSGAKEMLSTGSQRTMVNFLTAFATSYANFILVIGRRLVVWSVA